MSGCNCRITEWHSLLLWWTKWWLLNVDSLYWSFYLEKMDEFWFIITCSNVFISFFSPKGNTCESENWTWSLSFVSQSAVSYWDGWLSGLKASRFGVQFQLGDLWILHFLLESVWDSSLQAKHKLIGFFKSPPGVCMCVFLFFLHTENYYYSLY